MAVAMRVLIKRVSCSFVRGGATVRKIVTRIASPATAYRVAEQKDLNTVDDPAFPKEHFRIVVKQGNVALRNALDTGLAAIQADGSYASIYRKWFRAEPPVVPKLHKVAFWLKWTLALKARKLAMFSSLDTAVSVLSSSAP
jgi:hypothetical protein